MDEFEHRFAAILSADVAGYSALIAADAAATVRTLTSYRNEMASLVHQHRGRIVDAPGDNVLAEFESVPNAVVCATHMQHSLAGKNRALAAERRMRFRIGVHVGDVIVQEGRIYGDSVNVAARIQELAEPGGVRVSKAVAEQLTSAIPVDLELAGTYRLKNIRAPVETFRARPRTLAYALETGTDDAELPVSLQLSVPGFAGRPAIAVLRFQASGASTDEELFARGIAEELTTRLSAWRSYPVVACDSTAHYLPEADLVRVRNELRVRYVVKGTVRRSATRARITAQLIDTDTAEIVWTQQQEKSLGELFAMQEQIATAIAAALEPRLRSIEVRRALRLPPASLGAWECVQRGLWHMLKQRREDHAAAEALFRRALAEDPNFAAAHGFLAIVLASQIVFGWTQTPRRTLEDAVAAAELGLERDDQDPFVHRALGSVYVLQGQLERSIAANLKAVELNPSYALGYWGAGQQLALAGRASEGLAMLRTAMRLSPSDPLMSHFFADLAMAYFAAERYDEAIEAAERSLRLQQEVNWCWPYLIAALVREDRVADAQRAVDQAAPMMRMTLQGAQLLLARIGADAGLIERLSSSLRAIVV